VLHNGSLVGVKLRREVIVWSRKSGVGRRGGECRISNKEY
jgi:hypothetical protein